MASGMGRELEGGAGAADPAGLIARAPGARQNFRSGNRSDGFSWRLAAFYAAFFGFSGINMPFFPAWLQAKGLDSRATGIVLAVPMLIRLISQRLKGRAASSTPVWFGSRARSLMDALPQILMLSQRALH
jgi:MFS_1 like family